MDKNSFMKKIITFLLCSAFVFVISVISIFYLNYKEHIITTGEAFGFEIGTYKSEVYSQLYSNVVAEGQGYTDLYFSLKVPAEIEHVVGVSKDKTILVQSLFNPEYENVFQGRDVWKIYIDADRSDSIRLTFCEDKLCEIYRHKRWFDLTL